MGRLISKLCGTAVLWIFPLLCTLLPLKVYDFFIRKGKNGKEVMGWMMCFGGGVFFATYILHMVPEVNRILGPALIDKYQITYPVIELIMASGFFLVLTIEILAMDHQKRTAKKALSDPSITEVSHVSNGFSHDTKKEIEMEEKQCLSNGCPKSNGVHVSKIGDHCRNNHHCHIIADGIDECIHSAESDIHGVTYQHTGHDHHASRSLILIIALSLHRIFEGMSIGLMHSERAVWSLVMAVVCHETVISFSLGLQFVKNQFSNCRTFMYALVCSLILPLGMVIGTCLIEFGEKSDTLDIINGVLQGLSTGTFIYVTFFEILADEINHMSATKIRLLFLFMGFGAMAALNAIPEEEDSLELMEVVSNHTDEIIESVTQSLV